jgi:hypothetical protein
MAISNITDWKTFFKNPIVGLLFLSQFAIGYLYIDFKNNLEKQIEVLEKNNEKLNSEKSQLYRDIVEINKKTK